MSATATTQQLVRRVRLLLGVFLAGLVLSGLTAFALVTGVQLLLAILPDAASPSPSAFTGWILRVNGALEHVQSTSPFLMYGTDRLAFAHLVIAVAFIGPWRDPVRNRWVVQFGLIACAGVIPLARSGGSRCGGG